MTEKKMVPFGAPKICQCRYLKAKLMITDVLNLSYIRYIYDLPWEVGDCLSKFFTGTLLRKTRLSLCS